MFAKYKLGGFTPLGCMFPPMFNETRRMPVDLRPIGQFLLEQFKARKSYLRAALARKYCAALLSVLCDTAARTQTAMSRKRCRQFIVVKAPAL